MDRSVIRNNGMKKCVIGVALAALVSGCSVYREATAARPDPEAPWRAIATDADRDRLREWRKAWSEALPVAQAASPTAISADSLLFDPDRAQTAAALPVGTYQCRTHKLGRAGTGTRDYSVTPAVPCEVYSRESSTVFAVKDGAQRPTGQLFVENDVRMIFLGTMVLGDEVSPLRYNLDYQRDMIGYVERIAEGRWRLVFPFPHYESKLDVVEISAR